MLLKLWKEIMILVIVCLVIIHLTWYIINKKLQRKPLSRPSSRSGLCLDKPISPIKIPAKSRELSLNLQTVLFGPIKASVNQSRYESDFEHIGEIGWGGFGRVFKALHKVNGCHYAIKRIEVPNCEFAKKKVLREVTALSLLDHPGIIRFYNAWFDYVKEDSIRDFDDKFLKTSDKSVHKKENYEKSHSINDMITFSNFSMSVIGKDGSKRVLDCNQNNRTICDHSTHVYLYIQMQLCIKDTLKDWLSENLIDRDYNVTRDIFKQILSGVSYLHEQGLIHRDLKPSNIFFTQDGTVKIGDFGLVSCFTTVSFSCDNTNERCHDDCTTFAGTELYMSPEQLHNKPYDYKVDIYSLGLILIELLIPFSTQMERYKTLSNAKKSIFSFHTLEKKESVLIKKMLSYDPTKRPTSNQILDEFSL